MKKRQITKLLGVLVSTTIIAFLLLSNTIKSHANIANPRGFYIQSHKSDTSYIRKRDKLFITDSGNHTMGDSNQSFKDRNGLGLLKSESLLQTIELPFPYNMYPKGIDVASYQGKDINWHLVKAANIKFVFTKATEGLYYTNPYYKNQYNNAHDVNLSVGSYHFANPYSGCTKKTETTNSTSTTVEPQIKEDDCGKVDNGSGKDQAEFLLQNINEKYIEQNNKNQILPLTLDIEDDPYTTKHIDAPDGCYFADHSKLVKWIEDFVQTILDKNEFYKDKKVMIYTNSTFWKKCVMIDSNFSQEDVEFFQENTSLWLARWSNIKPDPIPPFQEIKIWQYTDNGKVDGIPNRVDLNIMMDGAAF